MLLTSECVLTKDEGGWTAEFPQFNGVATSRRTREEALKNAREVPSLEAIDLMDEGAKAPRARHLAEVVLLSVDVSAEDAERSKYETKAQVADHLDVSRPRVTALIGAGRPMERKLIAV